MERRGFLGLSLFGALGAMLGIKSAPREAFIVYVENEKAGYVFSRNHELIAGPVREFVYGNNITRVYNEVSGRWYFIAEGSYIQAEGKRYVSLGMFIVPTSREMWFENFEPLFLDPNARHVLRVPERSRDIFGKVAQNESKNVVGRVDCCGQRSLSAEGKVQRGIDVV